MFTHRVIEGETRVFYPLDGRKQDERSKKRCNNKNRITEDIKLCFRKNRAPDRATGRPKFKEEDREEGEREERVYRRRLRGSEGFLSEREGANVRYV